MAQGVVIHHRIVISLARKSHAVFGAAQFFAQLHHALVGFQFGIGFNRHMKAAQSAVERGFAVGERFERRSARIGRRRAQSLIGTGARLRHCLKRAALVPQISAHRFHQIGHQIVPPLQLHLNLRKRIEIKVFGGHQFVVKPRRPQHQHGQQQ